MGFQFSLFSNLRLDEHKAWLQSLDLQVKRRAYQKTITLRVDRVGGVRVGCSKTCPMREVERFLIKNRTWIEKSLKEAQTHQARYPKKTFCDGEEFLFLGNRLRLRHKQTTKAIPRFDFQSGEMRLSLSHRGYDLSQVSEYQKAMVTFYKRSGSTLLTKMVEENANRMGLKPNKLSFRSQKSRWGSCSSQGNISLNWRLVCAPARVANYVVIHELAHLQHHDHSARFWSLVEQYCPEYKACKNWLNHNQFEFDFLNV